MSLARAAHTETLLPDGRVLVVGGIGAKQNVLASAEIYDPRTKQFTAAGEMHQARAQHCAVMLTNGKVLVAGGAGSDYKALASAEVYDPATHTFTSVGNLNEARKRMADGASLLDGKAVIFGG